jgi:hypothetical protein
MPWSQLWWKLPLRLALDAVSAWKELLAGKGSYWLAVYNAHMAYCEWVLNRRKSTKLGFPALPTIYKGSVVWQYFIKKKKKFSEIVKHP